MQEAPIGLKEIQLNIQTNSHKPHLFKVSSAACEASEACYISLYWSQYASLFKSLTSSSYSPY